MVQDTVTEKVYYIIQQIPLEGDFIMSNCYNEPTLIVGKKGNAVLLSEEDWNAIKETLFLNSIPGMTESVRKGLDTPVEDCIPEDMVEW